MMVVMDGECIIELRLVVIGEAWVSALQDTTGVER